MTESAPSYPYTNATYQDVTMIPAPDKPDMMAYFEQRRRALIVELRAIDTLLGRRQTIPRKGDR